MQLSFLQPDGLLHEQSLQDNKGSYLSESDKGKGYGVQWKDFSRSGSGYGKGYSSRGKAPGVNVAVNYTDRNELTLRASGFLRDVSWMWV